LAQLVHKLTLKLLPVDRPTYHAPFIAYDVRQAVPVEIPGLDDCPGNVGTEGRPEELAEQGRRDRQVEWPAFKVA